MKGTIHRQPIPWDKLADRCYRVCYYVGMQEKRTVHRIVRFTRLLWHPPVRRIVSAAARVRRALSGRGVFRRRLATAVLLAVSVLVLTVTVQYWATASFGLSVDYGGHEIGCVADESTYLAAASQVQSEVINADRSFAIDRAPHMAVVMTDARSLLSQEAVCSALRTAVSDTVTRATGLYVDGVFLGALPGTAMNDRIREVLAEEPVEKDETARFFPQLLTKSGLYPNSVLSTDEEMLARLRALPIAHTRTVTYTETVNYRTVTQEMGGLPLGYRQVSREGVPGKQRVTAQIVLLNGQEQYRTVVATEVLKAAVDRVVQIGAQIYEEKTILGDGKATGTFIWPLPYTKTISSYFATRWGRLHGGIDIANGSTMGKPIIASDGGTVTEAGYHGSYGNYVLIDHGNGYQTRYAHCSHLNVTVGQKVAQGEYIGKVGNTGYSFGAHLHFEIIENGKLVNPLNYVKR